MTRMVAGMIMSLDGFIQGCAGSVAALYPDLDTLVKTKAFGGKRSPKLAAAAQGTVQWRWQI